MKQLKEFVAGQLLNAHASEGLDPTSQQPGKTFHDPNRTRIMETGCYNCLHFECETLAEAHFANRIKLDTENLRKRGLSPQAIRKAISNMTALAKPPKAGLCIIGAGGADLVMATYMCPKWSGRIKPETGVSDTPQDIRRELGEDVDTD